MAEETNLENLVNSEYSSEESNSEEYKEALRIVKKSEQFDLTGRFKQSFAFEVLLLQEKQNVVCSPISALMPIAKLAFGAEGATEDELFKTIGVINRSQMKDKFRNLIKMLKHLPGVKLHMASRIFVSDNAHMNKTFTEKTKSVFESSVVKVNFENKEQTAHTINTWMARESGKSALLNLQLGGISNSVIINIVAFEGDWQNKFHKAGKKKFHSPKGAITVPMMNCQGYYKYTSSDVLKAHVIEIPYKKKKASFVVVLPYSKTGLTGMLKHLKQKPELLNDVVEEMSTRQVVLTLPTFKIQSQQDLIPIYKSVGLNHIFHERSGLTGIIHNEQLTVGQAFHFTVIDVNEEGTKSATMTGVEMIMVSLDINRVIFTADHPFMFYVKVDKEQLFAGVYAGYNKYSLS